MNAETQTDQDTEHIRRNGKHTPTEDFDTTVEPISSFSIDAPTQHPHSRDSLGDIPSLVNEAALDQEARPLDVPAQTGRVEDVRRLEVSADYLETILPQLPDIPEEKVIRELHARRIREDKERDKEINSGLDSYLVKALPKYERAKALRESIRKRLLTSLQDYPKQWKAWDAVWQQTRNRIKETKGTGSNLEKRFRKTLLDGGFDSTVDCSEQGLDETIRRYLKFDQEPIVETAQENETLTVMTISGTEDAPTDIESQVLPLLPLPEKPTNSETPTQKRWKRGEFIASWLLALALGPFFGAALATLSEMAKLRDILAFHSPAGLFVTLVIGPLSIYLVGEGYKYVVSEFIKLENPHFSRKKSSTILLWALLFLLILFSIGDAAATAYLFRQAANDQTFNFLGSGPTTPEWVFWLFGVLVSGPLMVAKACLGRKYGLEACQVWEDYDAEVQRVEEENRKRREAQETQRSQNRERILIQRQSSAKKLEEDTEKRQRREEELRRRERQIASIRLSDPAITTATELLEPMAEAKNDLHRLEQEEANIKAEIRKLNEQLSLSQDEQRKIAEIDLETMLAMNESYRRLCGEGEVYFSDKALLAVAALRDAEGMAVVAETSGAEASFGASIRREPTIQP